MEQEEIITALLNCAIACEKCFDACLQEENVQMLSECIRLDRDCAQVCRVTASLIASGSAYAGELVDICSDICAGCARECEQHDHEHCQSCAEACRHCEMFCENFVPTSS